MKAEQLKTRFTNAELAPLIEFGLTKVQAVLYLTSLKYGILSVVELNKHTGVSRQQIYLEAEKMVALGVYDTTRRDRRKYIAAAPTKLVRLSEQRLAETQAALTRLHDHVPLLEALNTSKKYKTVIRHFEGIDKIKDAYMEELAATKNSEVLSLGGSLDYHFDRIPESFWNKWLKAFAAQKSHAKMIVHDTEVAQAHTKHDNPTIRDTRVLSNFPLTVNIDIFNTVVLIVSLEDETALWVESAPFAQSYKMLFQTLWELAKPIKTT